MASFWYVIGSSSSWIVFLLTKTLPGSMLQAIEHLILFLLLLGKFIGVTHAFLSQLLSWTWSSFICQLLGQELLLCHGCSNSKVRDTVVSFFPQIALACLSYKGSYFKLGGWGFADFVDSLRGGCHTGCRWRCRLVFVGFADPRLGCRTGCCWRCRLVCVRVTVRRSKTGLSQGVVWCV